MNTLVSDLTAFQLFFLIIAANTWFFGVLFALRYVLASPGVDQPAKKRLLWAIFAGGLIVLPSMSIMLKLH